MDKMKRMQELVELLNKAGKAYYQDAQEIMSNYEYDALYDELKGLEERFEKAIADKALEEIAEIDEQFHNVIFASTENDKLIQIFNNLQIQLYRYRMAHLKLDSSIPAIVAHHKGIIRAIENHDVEEGTTKIGRAHV